MSAENTLASVQRSAALLAEPSQAAASAPGDVQAPALFVLARS